MTPPVEPTAAERDPKRVQDARYHELATGQAVEWRGRTAAGTVCQYAESCVFEHFGEVLAAKKADGDWTEVPHYSSDGNAMLAVIDAMRERGYVVEVRTYPPGAPQRTHIEVWPWTWESATDWTKHRAVVQRHTSADAAPEAVVAAAVAALEGEAGR